MFQINEKSLADNRSLITIEKTKNDIPKNSKNGTIHYATDAREMWVTNPLIRESYIKKDPTINDKYDKIVLAKGGTHVGEDLTFTGNLTINEIATFKKDIVCEGNLLLGGHKTVIDTEHLSIRDNMIELNREESGAGISLINSGVASKRGTFGFSRWLYNETGKCFGADVCSTMDGEFTNDSWLFKSYSDDINGKLRGEFEVRTKLTVPTIQATGIFASSEISTDNITSTGLASLSTLTVNGNSVLNNQLNVIGSTSLNNTLSVTGASTFKAGVNVKGNITGESSITIANKASVGNTLEVKAGGANVLGDSTFSNNLSVRENLSIAGDVTSGGVTQTESLRVTNGIVSQSINNSGNVNISGRATIEGGLVSNGTSTLNGEVLVSSLLNLNNGLSVAGDITGTNTNIAISSNKLGENGNLTVGGSASITKDLEVIGGTTVRNLSARNISTTEDISSRSILAKQDFKLNAGDGNGINFWNSDKYSIYMSGTTHAILGGKVEHAQDSDYNMYFKMQEGINRSFVFKNGGTNIAQIQADGKVYTTGDMFIKGHKVLTANDIGSGGSIDADTVDGAHKADLMLLDGSQKLKGSLHTGGNSVKFTDTDLISHKETSTILGKASLGTFSLMAGDTGARSHLEVGGIALGNLKLQSADDINTISGIKALCGATNKTMISDSNDTWIRINPNHDYISGVYFYQSYVRTDGALQVGENGSVFNAKSDIFTYKGNNILTEAGTENMTGSINMKANALKNNSGEITSTATSFNVQSADKAIVIKNGDVESIKATTEKVVFAKNPYYGGLRLLNTSDEGHTKGLDADTVDGTHKSELMLLDGSQAMTGDLELGANKISFNGKTISNSATAADSNIGGTQYDSSFSFNNSVLKAGAVKLGSLNIESTGNKISNLVELNSDSGRILKAEAGYVKINDTNSHANGVYFGSSKILTNSGIYIGTNGSIFNASNTAFQYKGKNILTTLGTAEMFGDINFKDKKAIFGKGSISALESKTTFKISDDTTGSLAVTIGAKEAIAIDNTKTTFADNPYVGDSKILTTADEGHTKGIDADTIDGKHFTDLQKDFVSTSGDTINGKLRVFSADHAQIEAAKGGYTTIVSSSAINGEYLFGGKPDSFVGDFIKDYIRVGTNKLQYKSDNGTANIYHEGHKPGWTEINHKPSEFPPTAHDHDNKYYTEAEVDARLAEMEEKVNHLVQQAGTSVSAIITENMWVEDPNSVYLEYEYKHNCNIEIEFLDVTFYGANNSSAIISFDVIDSNTIKVYNDQRETVTVIVSGRSITADNTGIKEVIEARENYYGKVHKSLKERLDADYLDMVNGKKGDFVNKEGDESMIITNSIEGKAKEISIGGKTVGGLNESTGTVEDLKTTAGPASVARYSEGALTSLNREGTNTRSEVIAVTGNTVGGYDEINYKNQPLISTGGYDVKDFKTTRNDIVVEDIVMGDVTARIGEEAYDYSIAGKTLKNIFRIKTDLLNYTEQVMTASSNTEYVGIFNVSQSAYEIMNFEPGELYTIIPIIEFKDKTIEEVYIQINNYGLEGSSLCRIMEHDWNKPKLITKNLGPGKDALEPWHVFVGGKGGSITFTKFEIIILKGNHLDNPPTRYFKDLASFGSETNYLKDDFNLKIKDYVDSNLIPGNLTQATGQIVSSSSFPHDKHRLEYIPLPKVTGKCKIDFMKNCSHRKLLFYREDKSYITSKYGYGEKIGRTVEYDIPTDAKYIRVGYYDANNNIPDERWKFYVDDKEFSPKTGKFYNKNEVVINSSNKNLLSDAEMFNVFSTIDPDGIKEDYIGGKPCYALICSDKYHNKYTGFINFKKNTAYTFSFIGGLWMNGEPFVNLNRVFQVEYTDGTLDGIQFRTEGLQMRTFTSDPNKTIKCFKPGYQGAEWMYIERQTFQIEEGDVRTEYVKHAKTTISITTPFEDGMIGDEEYHDAIEPYRSRAFRRYKKYKITGNEAIAISGSTPYFNLSNYVNDLNLSEGNGFCGSWNFAKDQNKAVAKTMWFGGGNKTKNGNLVMIYPKGVTTQAELAQWFRDNPTEIFYPCIQEVCNIDMSGIKMYKEKTLIDCESVISPLLLKVETKYSAENNFGEVDDDIIEVVAESKNLFDNTVGYFDGYPNFTKEGNVFVSSFEPNANQAATSSYKNVFNLKKGVKYTLSADVTVTGGTKGARGAIRVYYEDTLKSVGYTNGVLEDSTFKGKLAFTLDRDANIRISFYAKSNAAGGEETETCHCRWWNIQLEENSTMSDYVDADKAIAPLEIPYEGGLKSVDTVRDIWYPEDGKVVQRIQALYLNEKTELKNWSNREGKIGLTTVVPNIKTSSKVLCSGLKYYKSLIYENATKQHVGISSDAVTKSINISISETDLSTANILGVKDYLKNNPMTVYYILETPIIHTVPKVSTVGCKNANHLYVNTGVQPSGVTVIDNHYDILENSLDDSTVKLEVSNKNKFINWKLDHCYNEVDGVLRPRPGDAAFETVKIKPSTSYVFNKRSHILEYDINEDFIRYSGIKEPNEAFITGSNTYYIKGYRSSFDLENAQMEEGSVITEYQEYDKQNISINLPYNYGFKSALNVRDEWNMDKGELLEKVEREIFNGSELWELNETYADSIRFVTYDNAAIRPDYTFNLISNNFIAGHTGVGKEAIQIASKGVFHVTVLKSKLQSQTVDGFKEYLNKNPLIVLYEKREPVFHKVDNLRFRSYEEFTQVESNNSQDPIFNFKIPQLITPPVSQETLDLREAIELLKGQLAKLNK